MIVVEPDLDDFSALAARLPEPWPEGLLLWLDMKPASLAARYLRAAGFVGTLAGPGALSSEHFAGSAGSALEGFVTAQPRVDPAAADLAARFALDYSTTYGGTPGRTAAMACDAVSLLIGLARRESSADLRRQFPVACGLVGVTGPLRFDQQGNRLVELEVLEFRAGKWSLVGAPR
jgi:ABC-type branched-subunit amino acid transport system substrate-binding protein